MIVHSKPTLCQADIEQVNQTLSSNMLAKGSRVRDFELKFRAFAHADKAVATTSGKASLMLALKIIDAGPGDEIIVPTYVCSSVHNCIIACGATPVIVDVSNNYTLCLNQVNNAISAKTIAIIAVHTYGFCADIAGLRQLVAERKITIIEDCAHSVGAILVQESAPEPADMGIYSFQATKVLTTAEGGMLTLNRTELIERYRAIASLWDCLTAISDLQASLGISQLQQLEDFVSKRRTLANIYSQMLSSVSQLQLPITEFEQPMVFRYIVQMDVEFASLQASMNEHGVAIRRGVDRLLHHLYPQLSFANSQRLFDISYSLPIYPSMDATDIEKVANSLIKVLRARTIQSRKR